MSQCIITLKVPYDLNCKNCTRIDSSMTDFTPSVQRLGGEPKTENFAKYQNISVPDFVSCCRFKYCQTW